MPMMRLIFVFVERLRGESSQDDEEEGEAVGDGVSQAVACLSADMKCLPMSDFWLSCVKAQAAGEFCN
jgi:hypothetical protein